MKNQVIFSLALLASAASIGAMQPAVTINYNGGTRPVSITTHGVTSPIRPVAAHVANPKAQAVPVAAPKAPSIQAVPKAAAAVAVVRAGGCANGACPKRPVVVKQGGCSTGACPRRPAVVKLGGCANGKCPKKPSVVKPKGCATCPKRNVKK